MKSHETNDDSVARMKAEIDEAFDHVTEYSDSQKERFESTLKNIAIPIERQIASLKTRSESLTGDAEKKMNRLALKLETQRDMFVARIKAMDAATGHAWLQLKDGLNSAWHDLLDSIEAAASSSH